MKWKNKYKPKVWTDLMIPGNAGTRKLVERLFTTGECASAGLLLHDTVSDGGTGKTTFVEMFAKVSGWPVIKLDTTGENVSAIDSLKKELAFFKNSRGLFGGDEKILPSKILVIGHEISKSRKDFIDGLRDIMDNNDEDVLFLFTDNDFAKLSTNHPQMFKSQRCVPLDWDNIPPEDIEAYCIRILEAEGKNSAFNRDLLKKLMARHKASIRGIIIGLENNHV